MEKKTLSEYCTKSEFLDKSADRVIQVIISNKLLVTSEEEVFNAVIRWVNHDVAVRELLLPKILEYVRLPLFPMEFLKELMALPVIQRLMKTSTLVRYLIREAVAYRSRDAYQRTLFDSVRTKLRMSCDICKVLYVLGPPTGPSEQPLHLYDWRHRLWHSVSEQIDVPRCKAGVTTFQGSVWVVGGCNFDFTSTFKTVSIYDPRVNAWCRGPPMPEERHSFGVEVLDGRLHVVGGCEEYGEDSNGMSSTAVCDGKEWQNFIPLNEKRYDLGLGVIGRKIFAVGGRSGAKCLHSIETFTLGDSTWTILKHQPLHKRKGFGVAVIDELLYIVGGDKDGTLSCYNPFSNRWSIQFTTMRDRRAYFGVVGVQRDLYVVGGERCIASKTSSDAIECYETNVCNWTRPSDYPGNGGAGTKVAAIDRSSDFDLH